MELDDIKALWQRGHEQNPAPKHTPEEIQAILKQQSQGILAKINRSILLEAGLSVLICVVCIIVYWNNTNAISIMGTVLVLSLGHYALKYRLLAHTGGYATDLKAHLTRLVNIMQRYLFGYEIVKWFTLFLFFCLGLFIFNDVLHQMPTATLNQMAKLSIFVGSSLVWVAATALLNWTLNKYLTILYGNHLQDLRKCLQELNK